MFAGLADGKHQGSHPGKAGDKDRPLVGMSYLEDQGLSKQVCKVSKWFYAGSLEGGFHCCYVEDQGAYQVRFSVHYVFL